MKLYCISILYKGLSKANLLKAAYDVSSFGFFHRTGVQEFMVFTSSIIVERTNKGTRASVKEQEYLCHVYIQEDGLAGVVISDHEYPTRVAFTLLNKHQTEQDEAGEPAWRGEQYFLKLRMKALSVDRRVQVLDEFSMQVKNIDWPSGSPATVNYTALDGYLAKYQNPRETDALTKVQAELDETKIILHNTMESLMQRGEKLDDLVSKSDNLSLQSKAFYKTARKQNSCCKLM